ncbi:hypothetical protein ACFX2H_014613 [Malus domestica]
MTEAAWTKVLKKAKSSIEIHLTRSVRSHIIEKMTAQEAWEKLENVYMGKTVSNKLFLRDELYGIRQEERGDIEDHVCRFQNCMANLQKVKETYKDDDMAIILLRLLCQRQGEREGKDKKKKEKKEGFFECGSADH